MKILVAAALMACLGMFGCGDDPDTSGGDCSWDVISDYNSMDCRSYNTCAQCDADKERFLRAHPDVNCRASTGYGLDERTIRITEASVRSLGC